MEISQVPVSGASGHTPGTLPSPQGITLGEDAAHLDWLRYSAILIPAVAVGLFEFLRHQLLATVLPAWLGHGWLGNVLAVLVVLGIVYGFVRIFGKMIDNAIREAARAREEVAVVVERQRIAREMHDGVAQTLFFLTASLREAGILVENDEDERALAELKTAETQVKEAHRRVRATIADLGEQIAREPFGESVRRAARRVAEPLGMRVGCEVTDAPDVASSSRKHLLAIMQEALTNAHRHGGAEEVSVRLRGVDGGLVLEVRDDGAGFDPTSIPSEDHYGLAIMAERARMVGGEFEVDSAPGRGARVSVYLPEVLG